MGPWGNEICSGAWQMGGVFMMIMMMVFWLLVIAGGVVLFRWFMRDNSGRSQNQSEHSDQAFRVHQRHLPLHHFLGRG